MQRYAVIIGNASYSENPLKNPINDAQAIYYTLKKRGFEAILICDATADMISDAIEKIKSKIQDEDIFFFYFAGHAYEHLGFGFLLPIDIPGFRPAAIEYGAYSIRNLLESTQNLHITRLIVLDACRIKFDETDISARNAIERIHDARSETETNQQNVLISYSTSYGDEASDGRSNYSPFTESLTELLLDHSLGIEEVFKEVCCAVIRKTSNKQRPWFYSSLESAVYLSDLPTYQQLQSILAPTQNSLFSLSTSEDKLNTLLVGSASKFFRINGRGITHAYHCPGGIQAAHVTNDAILYILTFSKTVIIPSLEIEIDLEDIDPIGITGSSDGRYILVYGTQKYLIYIISGNTCTLVYKQSFGGQYCYCATFVHATEAWIGGSGKKFHCVNLDGSKPKLIRISLPEWTSVYSITSAPQGKVLLTTCNGKIYEVICRLKEIGFVLSLGENVCLPSSRRSSLLDYADDDVINNFLFSPKLIEKETLNFLVSNLQSNDLIYSVHSKDLPILVVGSSEGIISIIDTRNWDNYQNIDASAGRQTTLHGLTITEDNIIIAATKDGHILFYSPTSKDYEAALEYIETYI